jgi:hypothetical protein
MFAATERLCPEPSFADLDFEWRAVECRSSAGTRYTRNIPIGMPQISSFFLDTVVYLYRNKAEAEEGKNFGGTGFLVTLPDETYPDRAAYFYAITNWHVACQKGFSTIRVNNKDGSVDVFEFGPEEWHFLPQYDVAVIPMPFNASRLKAAMLPTQLFVTKEMFGSESPLLGVGSDVFMIGRFIDHDGGQTNRPAARFGHVSVLPAPIIQPNKVKADSFCIDMHSRTGHSGSPVFVYRTPGSDIASASVIAHGSYLGILGIHWGQFPELWEIEKGAAAALQSEVGTLILEGEYVKGLSGMACVLPAWTILEVLKMPKLIGLRRDHTKKVFEPQFGKEGLPPMPEAAGATGAAAPGDDANPHHLKDFTRLVDVAARKRPQGDQT